MKPLQIANRRFKERGRYGKYPGMFFYNIRPSTLLLCIYFTGLGICDLKGSEPFFFLKIAQQRERGEQGGNAHCKTKHTEPLT